MISSIEHSTNSVGVGDLATIRDPNISRFMAVTDWQSVFQRIQSRTNYLLAELLGEI